MEDKDLKNPETWFEFGLTDYFDTPDGFNKFPTWLDVADEGIRIMGIDQYSYGACAIRSIAAAAARRGFDEDTGL